MRIFLLIFCITGYVSTQAQIQTDATGRKELAILFQNLNVANLPTGYLMEWGTNMTDKDDLNGITTISHFYYQINARTTKNAFAQPILSSLLHQF